MRRNGRNCRADGGCGVEHAHAAVPAAAVPAPRRHPQPLCMAAGWGSQQRFGDEVVDDAGDLLLVLQIREDGAGEDAAALMSHTRTPPSPPPLMTCAASLVRQVEVAGQRGSARATDELHSSSSRTRRQLVGNTACIAAGDYRASASAARCPRAPE